MDVQIHGEQADVTEPTTEHQLHHVEGISSVGRVRVRWVGHELHADADVAMRGDLALDATDVILSAARSRLTTRIPRLTDVLLHATPATS